MDGSRKLTQQDFNQLKTFVHSVSSHFNVSEPETHVAVIEYSDAARVKVSFKDKNNIDSLKQALDKLTASRGVNADVSEALKLAHEELFNSIGNNNILFNNSP